MITSDVNNDTIERNEIVAEWFKSDKVKIFLNVIAQDCPLYKDLCLLQDKKQDLFLWLLQRPIEFLRGLNNRNDWAPYIYKALVGSAGRSTTQFYKKNILFSKITCEYEEFKHDELFEQTDSEAFKNDINIINECITEIEDLPYLERWCIVLYIKYQNHGLILNELRGNGQPMHSIDLSNILSQARETVQNNLLKKEVINKKVPFVKTNKYGCKYSNHKTNEFRLAKNMLRLENLLSKNYNKKWSLPDKSLFALLHHPGELSSREIFDILNGNYESDLIGKYKHTKGKETIIISHALYNIVNNGILCQKILKFNVYKYYFPDSILQYIKDQKSNNEYIIGTIWKIFLYYYDSKLPIEDIANRFNLTEKETINKLLFAKQFIQSLLEEKKLSLLN
jgi:hypothetical protein